MYSFFKALLVLMKLFRGNDFLFLYVDASLHNFLDHRTAFRLQVGQLVIQEVKCR